MAFHAPLPGEKDFEVLDVLNAYLGNGMSSRLFLEVRENRGLAYSVRGMTYAEKNYSMYLIYVGATKEKLDEVKEIILKEMNSFDNMTDKDLDEAKERLIGLGQLKSEEGDNVKNELMAHEIMGKAEDYYEYDDKIRAVSLDDVRALAKKLVDQGYSTAAIVPKE